jgi:hypothetical protein
MVTRIRKPREAPEVGAAVQRMMQALVRRAGTGELEALEALVTLQADLDRALTDAVTAYRQGPAQATWAHIGEAVGTTRQAAFARFGDEGGTETAPASRLQDFQYPEGAGAVLGEPRPSGTGTSVADQLTN